MDPSIRRFHGLNIHVCFALALLHLLTSRRLGRIIDRRNDA